MPILIKKQKRVFTPSFTNNINSGGQALVLVLLALAVVLVIVLYILSRTITDISSSSSSSSAISAFSAAEAGVEQALVGSPTGVATTGTVGNINSANSGAADIAAASYTTTSNPVGKNATSFVFPVSLNSGDNMTLWLKSQDSSSDFAGSTVKICWGKVGTESNSGTTPAIEAVLFYGGASSAKIFRATYDPNAASRSPSNSFAAATVATCTIEGQVFPFSATLSIPSATYPSPQFMFVRMFYNSDTTQPVGFDSLSASTFPTQGILVDSSGSSGESNRRVSVFQGWPEVPLPFQFAVYSSTGLSK